MQRHLEDVDGADIVVASCDDTYFREFAPSLLESMNQLRTLHTVHLHLVEPSDETIERTRQFRERFGNIRLTYTADPRMERHKDNDPRIAFTAARFILAPILLEAGARRLLIIDIDSVMRTSPWPLIDQLRDTSVGFVFRAGPRRWQSILAGAVFFKADAPGGRFARRYARALLANVSARREYYVDQIVAHFLVARAGKTMRARINALPASIMSMTYEEGAAFWTAKGDDKYSDKFLSAQEDSRAAVSA